MEELVPDADGQLDVERGGEEGEEPVEGDQADLNVVEGEHLVKGWQVGCHLTRNNCLRGFKGKLPRSGGPSDQPGRPRGWRSNMRQEANPGQKLIGGDRLWLKFADISLHWIDLDKFGRDLIKFD